MAAPSSIPPELRIDPRRTPRAIRSLLLACHDVSESLPRQIKQRSIQLILDSCAAIAAVILAYELRFDFAVPRHYVPATWFWAVAMPLLRPSTIMLVSGYRTVWRHLGVQDAGQLLLASLPPSVLMLALRLTARHISPVAEIPSGVIGLDLVMFVGLAAGVRAFRRAAYEESLRSNLVPRRALLLGTKETFATALGQVRIFPDLEVVGLVAEEKQLQGFEIGRVRVIAEPANLSRLLGQAAIDVLLIADATIRSYPDAVSTAAHFGTEIRLLPSAANVMRGHVRVTAHLAPEKLFAKEHAKSPAHPKVLEVYRDRSVLITGAGGSIGSELCRQLCELGISRLLLLDNDENSIFEIHSDLLQAEMTVDVVPLVGDIRDQGRVKHVFTQHRPDIVLHSAAYKHVPVMETNASEAVLNNVIGTRNIADAALEFGSERFVMISSDKAVRPSSVMGATKRIAEMLVQNRANSRGTRFACVRFGNVVGTRGSVIPIFQKQIAERRPVTITDERMSRYFMTVTQAVELVLQASTVANKGEVYVLEMGNPVKIATIAHKMIAMSGQSPHTDVQIKIVGIRAGEKLDEVFSETAAQIGTTEFPRIYSIDVGQVPHAIETSVTELEAIAVERRESDVLKKLRSMPIGYANGGNSGTCSGTRLGTGR
jgi:FlaA1/EpsC-like NDP-sugar epimerase